MSYNVFVHSLVVEYMDISSFGYEHALICFDAVVVIVNVLFLLIT